MEKRIGWYERYQNIIYEVTNGTFWSLEKQTTHQILELFHVPQNPVP